MQCINALRFSKTKTIRSEFKSWTRYSNYATEADLKIVAGVDTSDFAKKTDWANLKSDVDK